MLFKPFALFATLALGVVSAIAIPTASDNAVEKRAKPAGIAKIFADATTALTPHTQQLQALTSSQLTTSTVQPIANNIMSTLNTAVSQTQALLGQPISVVLATVDGTAVLTVTEVSVIVSELVHLILGAIAVLLKFPFFEIQFLLVNIGQLVGTLVNTVILVTDGLLFGLQVAIAGLLTDVEFVITDLGLTILGGLLGLLGIIL
ncbi:hypothetical protein BDW22DRAFT_707313 [Trametopsis cervina]|nr:hypothetical protein BDW22DRAFT_707313 [Trametopsis cervina]